MFETTYKVGIKDINYGGHMGNEIPLILFQQARVEFFNLLKISELNIGSSIGIIQVESTIKYNKEVFFGEILTLKIENIIIEKIKMTIEYKVINENKECVVQGTTIMLGYNYELKKVSKIPESFNIILKEIRSDKL